MIIDLREPFPIGFKKFRSTVISLVIFGILHSVQTFNPEYSPQFYLKTRIAASPNKANSDPENLLGPFVCQLSGDAIGCKDSVYLLGNTLDRHSYVYDLRKKVERSQTFDTYLRKEKELLILTSCKHTDLSLSFLPNIRYVLLIG